MTACGSTDPSYGIGGAHEGNREEPELSRNVYRLDPKSGKMDVVVGDFSMPNGLCFSPDEKKFYVTDIGALGGAFKQTIIRVYDVDDDGKLSNGKLLHDFKDVPQPYIADDIRADEDGNIWAAGGWSPNHALNGVRVFAPDGTPLGAIVVPEVAANLCFGGHHHNRLFICASTSCLCDRRGRTRRRNVKGGNEPSLSLGPSPGESDPDMTRCGAAIEPAPQ
jgi:gluconolactonase